MGISYMDPRVGNDRRKKLIAKLANQAASQRQVGVNYSSINQAGLHAAPSLGGLRAAHARSGHAASPLTQMTQGGSPIRPDLVAMLGPGGAGHGHAGEYSENYGDPAGIPEYDPNSGEQEQGEGIGWEGDGRSPGSPLDAPMNTDFSSPPPGSYQFDVQPQYSQQVAGLAAGAAPYSGQVGAMAAGAGVALSPSAIIRALFGLAASGRSYTDDYIGRQ
jgi:hypothetical protein